MKKSLVFLEVIVFLAACSGLEQPGIDERIPSDDLVQKVILEVLPIKDGSDVDTKASAVPNGNNVNFSWEATDTVGIFPDLGSQVYFLIDESSVGKSSASFDGGAWALKQNSTYVSYYPLVGEFYLQRDKIPVSFANQKQIGTSAPFNGARYFLATGPTTSDNGVLRFSYNTLNTIFNINATLPAGTYTKAMMTLNEPLFVEEGTYSLDDPQIVGTEYTNTLQIDLEDVTLSSQGVLPIYLMSAPVDLRGKEVTIKVISSDGKKYECVKTLGKNYEAGTRYGLTCNEMTQSNAGNIVFADPNIKSALVAAFDTEGDGELSYMEAAAVTSIEGVFGTKKTYTSFDEFQYFTGVTSIPNSMFEGWQITSIVLPESVSNIGSSAFRGCVKLTSISIPNLVNTIYTATFSGCIRLSTISLPESLSRIQNSAFYGCSSLASINIPEFVTRIDSGTFYGCSSLTSINIPGSVTSIGSTAFYECSSLASINLPESVTRIDHSAFSGCSSLTSVIIPEAVYKIEDYTFCKCSSLTSVSLPESVSSIGIGAFSGCSSLTSIIIPEAVATIGDQAFSGCSSLTSITLPESVTSIGSYAFYGCRSLNSIVCLANTPPTGVNISTFNYTNGCGIYVPAGYVDAYKTAEGWSYYADRIYSVEGGFVPPSGDGGDE